MVSDAIKLTLKTIPEKPGVYQYYDKDGKILYVGKAKNLKRRVSSYFHKEHDSYKTVVLVRKIVSIEYIVVKTETDALLLENNLIKKYQPRYNILLKDDKTYPWICIKKERFPRIFLTRNLIKDGSEYFGPYASVKTARTLLELIKELYPIRTCNYDLSTANIDSGKYKVCLEYHIGNCLGPCEDYQDEGDYMEGIKAIRHIIRGNFSKALQPFKDEMAKMASELKFEDAQKLKEKMDALSNYQARSTVLNPKINNVDVYSIISDEEYGYVNFMKINHGAIIQSHTLEVKKKLEESDAELLELAITELRGRFQSTSREIYVSEPLDMEMEGVKIIVPQIGEKKQIVELSQRNAKYFRQERFKQIKIVDPDRHVNRLMQTMKKDLRLSEEPRHIECFDNSNIQGTNPVAACVVFKDGKPSKKDYRNFNIKSVEGPDDFASMEEVIYRRYSRMLDEKQSLPQLIVIDGGKGQLSSALKSLDDLGLRGKIAIIGIAKRLEEIFYPDDPVPLYLDKRSETLKTIQHLRNEAHRFGITHHRNRRSKAGVGSELDTIPGIGPKTVEELYRSFKTLKSVKAATLESLASAIGKSKAEKVYAYFNKKEE